MPSPPATDVLIVGAGLSGLALARTLLAQGLSVRVLEARRRVGGRLLSVDVPDEFGGGRVDLGATWFWGNEPNVAALCEELGVETFPQTAAGEDLADMPDGVSRVQVGRAASEFRIAGGAATLTDRLAEALPPETVRLQARVRVLERDDAPDGDACVTARYEQEGTPLEITARRAVISLPPAAAVSALTFRPELPDDLRQVLSRVPVWMGATGKVVAVYDRPFWRDAGWSGRAFSRVGPLFEIHDACGPGDKPAALFGFCMPRIPQDPGPTRDDVLPQLQRLFGDEALDARAVFSHFWWLQPNTVPREALGLDDYTLYGHPMLNRPAWDDLLYWTSTETAVYAPGHMEGALETGRRVAQKIVESLS